MIKASEAAVHYDLLTQLAEDYIEKHIEPEIKAAMHSSRQVVIEGYDEYAVGPSLPGIPRSAHYWSVTITDRVKEILRENGYGVRAKVTDAGTEYRTGKAEFIIDWTDADKDKEEN